VTTVAITSALIAAVAFAAGFIAGRRTDTRYWMLDQRLRLIDARSETNTEHLTTVHQLLRAIDTRCGAHTERLAGIEWQLIQRGVLPPAEETETKP
jgi:hypothetical protein